MGILNTIKESGMYRPIRNWRIARKIRHWTGEDERRLQFYRPFIPERSLVFDVGANLGNRTKLFLRAGASVVAVEPQKPCVDILRAAFGRHPRLVILQQALDRSEGVGVIRIDDSLTISSMSSDWIRDVQESGRFLGHRWEKSAAVQTTTLDRLIATYGMPSFIKIDVEGFELNVLQGLSRPCKTVSLEYTPERYPATEACIDRLASLGPLECNYSFGETMIWALPGWISAAEMKTFLQRVRDSREEGIGDVYLRFL
jgi:FkbM family methyltransferase